jgi:cytochrome c553
MQAVLLAGVLAMAGASAQADTAAAPPKPDMAKGSTIKQLSEFKDGKRNNPIMKPMASSLSADDMRNVAAFYESKVAKPGSATHKDTVDEAREIWKAGIPDRKVPACAGCHGPTGAGIPSQYPRLGGQWAAYTETQLTSFRAGQRANSPQMQAIAARLSDNEIKALADFMAGLR